jgi:flagellum-specific peptidoglycan hydrolase FlgJ
LDRDTQRHLGRHFIHKSNAERYATDPEYRASLIVTKYADR